MPKRCGALLRCLGSALAGVLALALAGLLTFAPLASAAQAAPGAAIVLDAKTGKVLYSNQADSPRHPASLTKMMTLYLLFEAIESGKTSLNDRISISVHAASQAPSKLGLKPGQTIRVRDAILALVTKSANDIAVAVAEHIDGSESAFAAHMTRKAREMGMLHTVYKNASGLPDSRQITTARDLTVLARALRDHYPQYYSYFSTPSFVWNGRRIANHNRLLGRVKGVNGIKTGYTRASGFNLVTSVDRSNRMIIAVVLGGKSSSARDKRMAELIETYLPRATRGKRTVAMVNGKGPASGAGSVEMAVGAQGFPIPNLRPSTVADAGPAIPVPAPDAAPVVAAAAPAPVVVASAASPDVSIADLVAGANSIFALDGASPQGATAEGDTNADDDTSDATPPPAPSYSGWRIQIAASPTKDAAEDLLDQALASAGNALAGTAPYTEPVVSGGSTLYRARFAGFRSKEAAWAACTTLKKQKFACLAVSD